MGNSGAWAVDCPQNSYSFITQAQVDDFPEDCDSVLEYLTVANTTDITNIEALANLTSVGGDLYIGSNADLANIEGLANLTRVGGYLEISDNGLLTNIEALANLTSVGGYLDIYENDLLINLDGLAKLTSVGGRLSIEYNDLLINLDGLAKLTSVAGRLSIQNNAELTNCQGVAPVLGWASGPPDDSVGGIITIESNATGCNSVEEILASYSKPLDPAILWFLLRPTNTEDEDE